MASIEALLKDARDKLVETGTRNRLIHVNRKAQRGNFLNIIDERTADIYQILRVDGKKMKFAGKGEEEEEEDSTEVVLFSKFAAQEVDEEKYTDLILETPLTPDALQKRLLKLARDTRTAEEEQGINILYLAMGFLQWKESHSSKVERESPLILVPVDLVRNNRTSTFDIVCRDDDIETNRSLSERLRTDFGITLPEIDDSKDWLPSDYFRLVEEAISAQADWGVDDDGMQLGFFSFAKLLMLRDLDPENWDEQSLLENDMIRGLLSEGFEAVPALFNEDDNLDEKIEVGQILHVVDADSSQTRVIEEVKSGRNLVVQGPPGTGKSQTITNILAAAAYDDKKVLFVAEKMAALDVVYNRMRKIGLVDMCLELHSRSANKKQFFTSIGNTLANSQEAEVFDSDLKGLIQTRDELNRITNLLHSPVAERDYTPFEVLSKLVAFAGKKTPPPVFDASEIEDISKAEEQELLDSLDKFLAFVKKYGFGEDNPYRNTTNLDLQPTDLLRLKNDLTDVIQKLESWIENQTKLEVELGWDPSLTLAAADKLVAVYEMLQSAPVDVKGYIHTLEAKRENKQFVAALTVALDWVEHKERLTDTVTDVVWTTDIGHLRLAIVKGMNSWLSRIFGKYKSASLELGSYLKGALPILPKDRLELLDDIIEGKLKKDAFDEEKNYFEVELGSHWRGERTPFKEMVEVLDWLNALQPMLGELSADGILALLDKETIKEFDSKNFESEKEELLAAIAKVGDRLGIPEWGADEIQSVALVELRDRMTRMLDTRYYELWKRFQLLRNAVLAFSVHELLVMLETGRLGVAMARDELEFALAEARWKYVLLHNDEIRELDHIDRHELVTTFKNLEEMRTDEVRETIKHRHLSQVPTGAYGGMGIIRGEIGKKTRHQPIRKMMKSAGEMIQRIKPIFLMSPISVAQFLPRGKVEFDLLVIDEASQVKPQDALGSIARAKQIVVVGDQKQLPPTSFFDRLTGNDLSDDEEEEATTAKATEMESVLSLCEARGLPQSMLMWHYRSRDPSLITVSNIEFYQNRLILPPCPAELDDAFGLKLVRVPGVYSSRGRGQGRAATNRIEAEAVADRLKELVQTRPDFSVGIVTFSKAQADMMTEVLELRRREDPELNDFLQENKAENVFVKNIENVQGDERDVILISVGYGPNEPNGRLASMRFGPINSEGGERRLNVMFSRSRIITEVFTSFDPNDIIIQSNSKEGPRVLKKFLKYAESRELIEHHESQGEADSEFEEDVAHEIRKLGYQLEHQVGARGFKIDLGVKDRQYGQNYILAVECDGATYHSAIWARERDRFRQQVLESFGWRFHRIWSTDWYYRRRNEIARLKEALNEANSRDFNSSLIGSNRDGPKTNGTGQSVSVQMPIRLEESFIQVPPYERANLAVETLYEPHERPPQERDAILTQIITVEGPIHFDVIVRRYTKAHGKSHSGSRIKGYVRQGLSEVEKGFTIQNRGEFWGTAEQYANLAVRSRGNETGQLTNAEYIPPEEIVACAALIENDSGPVEIEEMIRGIAKTMGFKRAGSDFQSHVRDSLASRSSPHP